MKVRGRLTFRFDEPDNNSLKNEKKGEFARIISSSLAPDNISGIKTMLDKNSVTVTFSADKIGTILSSIDDYLMNASVAENVIKRVKK